MTVLMKRSKNVGKRATPRVFEYSNLQYVEEDMVFCSGYKIGRSLWMFWFQKFVTYLNVFCTNVFMKPCPRFTSWQLWIFKSHLFPSSASCIMKWQMRHDVETVLFFGDVCIVIHVTDTRGYTRERKYYVWDCCIPHLSYISISTAFYWF